MRIDGSWMREDTASFRNRARFADAPWRSSGIWNRASACGMIEREPIILFSEGYHRARTQLFCSSFAIFSALSGARASHARPEAEVAGAILHRFSGQWTRPDETSGGISAQSAAGISGEYFRNEFRAAKMAGGGAERRYFPCRYWSRGNRRAARSTAYRRSARARSFCERHEAAVRDRLSRRLRLRRERERTGAFSLRSQIVEAAGRKRASAGLAVRRA